MNTKCGRDGDGIYPNISNFLPHTSPVLAMFINISQEPLGDNKRTKLLTQKVKGKPDRVARDFLACTTKHIITILTWLVVSCYTALLAKSWKLIKASALALPLHWWADQPAGQLVSYWDWHELRHHCRPLAGEMEIITHWDQRTPSDGALHWQQHLTYTSQLSFKQSAFLYFASSMFCCSEICVFIKFKVN